MEQQEMLPATAGPQRSMSTYLLRNLKPALPDDDIAAAMRNFHKIRDALEEKEIYPHISFGLHSIKEINELDPGRRPIWPMYDASLHPRKPSEHCATVILRDAQRKPISAAIGIYCPIHEDLALELERGALWYGDPTEMQRRGQKCHVTTPLFRGIRHPVCFLSALWTATRAASPVMSEASVATLRLVTLYALSHWNCDIVAISKLSVMRGLGVSGAGMAAWGGGCWLPYDGDTLQDRARYASWLPRADGLRIYLHPTAADLSHKFWSAPV